MATESPLETLQREITCSICLSYFKEPVSIDCGHNFCQSCITQCWGRSDDENTSCPQCRRWSRKRSFRPNRELGNVVEVAKRLRLEAATSLAGQRLCEKHQEPLKLFCEEDETPVCVICRESRAHKAHPMLPIEEAAQDYKARRNPSDRLYAILWRQALEAVEVQQEMMAQTSSPTLSASLQPLEVLGSASPHSVTHTSGQPESPSRQDSPTPGWLLTLSLAKELTKMARASKLSATSSSETKKKKKKSSEKAAESVQDRVRSPAPISISAPPPMLQSSVPMAVLVPVQDAAPIASTSEGEIREASLIQPPSLPLWPCQDQYQSPHYRRPQTRRPGSMPLIQKDHTSRHYGGRQYRSRSTLSDWDRHSEWDLPYERSQDWGMDHMDQYHQPNYPHREFYNRSTHRYRPAPLVTVSRGQDDGDTLLALPPIVTSQQMPPVATSQPMSPQMQPTHQISFDQPMPLQLPTVRQLTEVPSALGAPSHSTRVQDTQRHRLDTTGASPLSDTDGYQSDSTSQSSLHLSIPSPDAAVESQRAISPSEGLEQFTGQVIRMSQSLGLETQQSVCTIQDPVFDAVYTELSRPVAIPFLPTLHHTVQQSWKTPSSMPPTSKRLEGMYRVQDKDAGFLFTHPVPNSVVVEAAQGKSRRLHSSPVDKEGRRLDLLGRRLYSSATLGIKVSNYQAVMSGYQFFLWKKVRHLFDHLPEDKRDLAQALQGEAMQLCRQQINTSQHQVDCNAKVLVGAIALRRHSWLRSTGLSQEAQSRIEDLPFDGHNLFNAKTDRVVDSVQKAQNAARRMRLSQPPPYKQRRWYRHYATQYSYHQSRSRQASQQQALLRRKRYFSASFRSFRRESNRSHRRHL